MSILNGMPQPLFEIIGVAGFVFYMLAYALLQMRRISGQGYTYTVLNLLAAILVLISLTRQFNLASMLIQVSWVAISVYGLIRRRSEVRQLTPARLPAPDQVTVSARSVAPVM